VQQGDPFVVYREILTAEGLTATEIERQIHVITEQGSGSKFASSPLGSPTSIPSETIFLSRSAASVRVVRLMGVWDKAAMRFISHSRDGW